MSRKFFKSIFALMMALSLGFPLSVVSASQTATPTSTAPVTVTLLNTDGVPQPGLKVYVFNDATYTGYNATTDVNGQSTLTLPWGSYRFRADLNGTQFWSGASNHCDVPGCESANITVSKPLTLTVLDTDGSPKSDVSSYAFNGTTYAGYSKITDANGQAVFTLPLGSYRFRADLNVTQFWSGTVNHCDVPDCESANITVSKPVTVAVLDTDGSPKPDVSAYAFNGTIYTGYSKITDANGQAVFTLPLGSYRFRADLNGTQFWSGASNHCDIPSCESTGVTVTIPLTVSVQDGSGASKTGVNVYAFNGNTYTGYSKITDANGEAIFTLPQDNYRFRADYSGTQYWSGTGNHCVVPGCLTVGMIVEPQPTATSTNTTTPTQTPIPVTPTDIPTATPTHTETPTPAPTDTSTATSTDTETPTPITPTSTVTSTSTSTETPTSTSIPTHTETPTSVPPTNTATSTSTPTETSTSVPPTSTATSTSTPTETSTSVPPTSTATSTSTPTETSTSVPPTSTATSTSTPTETPTSVPPTNTVNVTPSPTKTNTPTVTPTPLPIVIYWHTDTLALNGQTLTDISQTRFRALAYDPNVGTNDGDGINKVVFSFAAGNPTTIASRTDKSQAYCAFSGNSQPCDPMPTATFDLLLPGTYTVYAQATSNSGGTSPQISLTFVIPTPAPLCSLITANNAHIVGDNVEVDLTNNNLVADAYLQAASISWAPNPIGPSNYFDLAQWNGAAPYYDPSSTTLNPVTTDPTANTLLIASYGSTSTWAADFANSNFLSAITVNLTVNLPGVGTCPAFMSSIAAATPTFTPSRTPTPSNTPTITLTRTPSKTPTITLTRTPTFTPSKTLTPTLTFTPSKTPTITLTRTPSNTPTRTFTPTPTRTPTKTVTRTPSPTVTNTITATATFMPTDTETVIPTPASWITVTNPNGGEVLSYGDVYPITWQSSPDIGMVEVVIVYRYTCEGCSPNWVLEWNAGMIPNTGTYDWAVNVDDPANKEFIVAIQGVGNYWAWDESNNPFTVALSDIPTVTGTATQTVTPTPTASPTQTVTLTPTLTPTQTKTATPTFTKNPTPTLTPTPIGAGLFEPYINYPVGDGEATGIADFNNDGLLDVAMAIPNQLLIFLQKSDGTLGSPVAYPALYSPESLAVGDLNNDGRTDIVVLFNSSNTISVYLQQADGTLAARITYPTSSGPDSVAIGDINGDGLADITVSHWTASNIGIFIQNASGTLNPMVTYASPEAGYDDIAIGDINGDGRNDVVKMNGQGLNPNLSVYTQNTDGTLANAISYQLGCNCLSKGLGIGDVTGDGLADIVISYGGNRPSSKIAVFAQASDGTLQSPVSYDAYDIPSPVEIADVNSDGLADVLVANSGTNTLSVYLQQSNGVLHAYSRYTILYVGYQPQSLAIGDINHDGLPDVASADYNKGLTILYHKHPPVSTSTPTLVPTLTLTPTYIPVITHTPTVTPTETDIPTLVPTLTSTPTYIPAITHTPTIAPTETETASPTDTMTPNTP